MTSKIKHLSIALLLLLLSGCGGGPSLDSYLREEVPFNFIRKVAILPLANNTANSNAHKLVRDVINTQTLALGLFDTVDQGVLDHALYQEAIKPGDPLNKLMLERLGKRLGVQAFFMGAVDIFGSRKVGSAGVPEISLTLRLVEAKSGTVLWQASGYNDGSSLFGRLFGISPPDNYAITKEMVRKLLYTVPEGGEPDIEEGG